MQTKKRFVLSGYFGFKNFGDEAILSVLISKLRENKHKITVISSDPPYTKSKFRFVRSIYTFDIRDIIGAIAKTDFLVSGGGSLLQDTTSLKSLLYYLFIIFTGVLFGKKVIIFAQGIGPIKSAAGKILTKTILRWCTYVSVRDYKSHELLQQWGINAELLCDPVFSITVPKVEKEKAVAVQLRDCPQMSEDFVDRLADKIVREFPDYKIKIFSFQDAIDLDVCKRFEKSLKLLNSDIKTKVYTGLTDEETIQNIAKSEYLIAMRFHALIAGLLSKVRLLGINYDIKVEKLANEFNFPLLDLKDDFGQEFTLLKEQNIDSIGEKVRLKHFDWTGFERTINN